MGQMKRFGMRLARMVYEDRMSDADIIKTYQHSMPTASIEWLKEQIKSVRDNPEMWRPLANKEA